MSRPTSSGRTRRFGPALLTLGLIAVLVGLQVAHALTDGTDRDGVALFFFESLFLFVPIGAGLFAGQMARLDIRALGIVTAALTILMIGQDFLPPSDITQEKRALAYRPATGDWDVQETWDLVRWAEGGSIPLVAAYVSGDLPAADQVELPIPAGHPRIQLAWSLFKVGYLFAPFIAVGFVVAIRTWGERNVRFRTRSAERLFNVGVAWIVGPLIPLLFLVILDRSVMWALEIFGLGSILIPPIALASAAAFGWRTGLRAERNAAYLDDIPLDG